ncbi:ABC transporter permease [Cyanobium sp. Morenito 9A2]|uniref:ABC transporter permease n=1 Tax=Cyanobium sp. Morenito 9A2 TaxID=2823718 RepID=UPI0020CCF510|nr:iron export ABC transporter permease subunit FetB [Cyanobium sp. Morenito 9A2]MCP9848635.1 iron export ABC transporter permease subunit FetB [Cyanobium sp. Morenito 9A2]
MTPAPAGALAISDGQLALSALLILVNVGLSVVLRLGLGRSLVVASLRMVVQLLLVGSVLEWLFRQDDALLIVLVAVAMALIAAVSAVQRTRRRFAGIYLNSLLTVLASAALVTGLAVVGLIRPQPWYDPQYLIPLLGMVLGNTLNGLTLGLDRFMEGLRSGRDRVETALALGGTRWEACQEVVRDAIRVAMIPTINSMMVMGLVSLPGMMTGQILQGAAPEAAVRYQIVILFMIASATALGVFGVVGLAYGRLTSADHQLRLDRLVTVGERGIGGAGGSFRRWWGAGRGGTSTLG